MLLSSTLTWTLLDVLKHLTMHDVDTFLQFKVTVLLFELSSQFTRPEPWMSLTKITKQITKPVQISFQPHYSRVRSSRGCFTKHPSENCPVMAFQPSGSLGIGRPGQLRTTVLWKKKGIRNGIKTIQFRRSRVPMKTSRPPAVPQVEMNPKVTSPPSPHHGGLSLFCCLHILTRR